MSDEYSTSVVPRARRKRRKPPSWIWWVVGVCAEALVIIAVAVSVLVGRDAPQGDAPMSVMDVVAVCLGGWLFAQFWPVIREWMQK